MGSSGNQQKSGRVVVEHDFTDIPQKKDAAVSEITSTMDNITGKIASFGRGRGSKNSSNNDRARPLLNETSIPAQIRADFDAWLTDEVTSHIFTEGKGKLDYLFGPGIDEPLTEMGSTFMHVLCIFANRPSFEISARLLVETLKRGANPNAKDSYGRTPLVRFITDGGIAWADNPELGAEILERMFEAGVDANIMYRPKHQEAAGCELWTLAHDLEYSDLRKLIPKLPAKMKNILDKHLDKTIKDSAGRLPKQGRSSILRSAQ